MNNKRAESLVAITISIALLCLFIIFIMEHVIKFNIAQNESAAQTSLKQISAALENYANDHLGSYPSDLSSLTMGNPVYLDREYLNDNDFKGYNYHWQHLDATGYHLIASPLKCRVSGKTIFEITTGGTVAMKPCLNKEE